MFILIHVLVKTSVSTVTGFSNILYIKALHMKCIKELNPYITHDPLVGMMHVCVV